MQTVTLPEYDVEIRHAYQEGTQITSHVQAEPEELPDFMPFVVKLWPHDLEIELQPPLESATAPMPLAVRPCRQTADQPVLKKPSGISKKPATKFEQQWDARLASLQTWL